MNHADAIKNIYNGLVHKYQFDIHSQREKQVPERTRFLASEKSRESTTNKLEALAHMALDLGEMTLASIINKTAQELGSDAVQPMPM